MKIDTSRLQTDGQIAMERTIINHITLDYLAFIAQRNYEVIIAVTGIVRHDVPQNRAATNLHHRFGLDLRLFSQARAMTTG